MPTTLRQCRRIVSVVLFVALCGGRVSAEEIWVAPTHQQDVGGLGVASNVIWPVTAIGAVRLALALPDNLETFQSAKLVLLPNSPGGAANLVVYVCGAQPGSAVASNCSAATPHPFVGTANQLVEVDISAAVAARLGGPGVAYIGILAYSTPTTNTDRIVGMRFAYDAAVPAGAATLGANTFTGTQTAPAFVGDGSGLTNLPAPANMATLGANTFSGTQSAPAFTGNGASVTNVNATLLDGLDSTAFAAAGSTATLGANTFTGTQTIDMGNLDLDPSTAATGNITKNGARFLHNFGGTFSTFLGENAGNFTMTGANNTGIGRAALNNTTTGGSNTAVGLNALFTNTTGSFNVASGWSALSSNTVGATNAAFGFRALVGNSTGSNNVATGGDALRNNGSGTHNVGVGFSAGFNGTTGSNNIYLGANVLGVAGESNTMYLGNVGTQNTTYIAGVRETAVSNGEMVVIDPNGRLGSLPVGGPGPNSVGSAQVIDNSITADDLAPDSVGPSEVAFNYAASANEGGVASNADLLDGLDSTTFAAAGHGHDVSQVTNAARLSGGNSFSGDQTLASGNIVLDDSTPTTGTIMKNGMRFLHNSGVNNTNVFLGLLAGNFASSGNNTGLGTVALTSNTTGIFNTATGNAAMQFNSSGSQNVAVGHAALLQNTAGSLNVAVGEQAGMRSTTGSFNIYLGAEVLGVVGESNTMYLGKVGTQTKTLIAGVRAITTGVNDAIPVVIDSNGQLGTISSSRRYKEDIQDMADASRRLLQLRPVTFRYTQAFAGGAKPVQYGLIAEEVAETFPELAVFNADGEPETVKYQDLSVLLLNELQKQQHEVQRQQRALTTERARVEALEAQMTELLRRLSTLESVAR